MSAQPEHRYIVRLVIPAAGVDPYDAVHHALDQVPSGALGRFTVGVELVNEGTAPDEVSGPATPGEVEDCAWGCHDHSVDTRYHSKFLGVASSKVVLGADR